MAGVTSPLDLSESDRVQLAAVVESSDDAIMGQALDGTVRSWNPAAERIFGYKAADMIGASISRLVPPELHNEDRHILERIRAGEQIVHYETTRLRRDGERVVISLTVSPIPGPDGVPTGALALARDMTAHRNLEDQLRQTQKMEALGRLVGGVAHDFNNILTIISAFTIFLGRSVTQGSPGYSDLLGIKGATERASRLTSQLLDFTRRQAATLEVVNVTEVVNETATMLNRILGENIRLDLRTDSSPAWTLADPGRLSQILINLAVNARDAMPDGGTLTIGTYDDTPAERVMLTVRDTGHGMDARTRALLFDPFFTTKPKGQGTGIGLATVFEIVHESGGQIEIDTAPGRGAVFRIALPRADRVQAAGGQKDPEVALRGHETVLVVDDEPAIAELTARILLEYGYTVIQANGPGGAMVAFAKRTTPVDLVLTDIMMPGMSGRALVQQLRERDPNVTVLYMSGYSNATPSSFREAFIAKPFTAQEIARAVRAVLDGRQLA